MRIDAPLAAEIGDVSVRPPITEIDVIALSSDEAIEARARLHATFHGFVAAPKPETD